MSNSPISSRQHDYTHSAELCRNLDELQDQRFATEVLDKLLLDLGLPLGFRPASGRPLPFASVEMYPRFLWRRWISIAFWVQSLVRRHHRQTLVAVEGLPSQIELAMPDGGLVLVIRFVLDDGSDVQQTRLIPIRALSSRIQAQVRRRFAEYFVSLRENGAICAIPTNSVVQGVDDMRRE